MEKLNKSFFTKENLAKAAQCKTPEELIELAKEEGIEVTKEQAEAYLEEFSNLELDDEMLEKIAGGSCYGKETCNKLCPNMCWTAAT